MIGKLLRSYKESVHHLNMNISADFLTIINAGNVVLGTHNLKKAEKTMIYQIKKKCKHPSYKNAKSGNDIMLLKVFINSFITILYVDMICMIYLKISIHKISRL